MAIPQYHALFNPLLEAIKELGGSASIAELDEKVAQSPNLTDQEIAEPHDNRRTELQYRLAWARTYLKAYGLLDNSARGVWVLTPKGKEIGTADPRHVTHFVQDLKRTQKSRSAGKNNNTAADSNGLEVAEAEAILKRHGERNSWRNCSICHRQLLSAYVSVCCASQALSRSK